MEIGIGQFLALKGIVSIERSATPGADKRLGTTDDGVGLKIAVTHVSLFVGDQGGTTYNGTDESVKDNDTGLWLTDGTALLLLGGDGFAGHISAGAALYIGSGRAASVDEVSLDINQRAAKVTEEFQAGGEVLVLDLPAGPYLRVAATGIRIAIAGQSLTADLAITRTGTVASPVTRISFANVSLSLGSADRPVVLVTDGQGEFTVQAGGIFGSMSVHVALNVPNVTLSGTFALALNTTDAKQGDIEKGVTVTGTDVVLGVAGQRLTGAFTVRQNPTTKEIWLALDMTLELGNGTETLVSVSVAGPVLIAAQGVAGSLDVEIRLGAGLAARLDEKLVIGEAPDFALPAHFAFNTGTKTVNGSIELDGKTYSITNQAGGTFQVQAGKDRHTSLDSR